MEMKATKDVSLEMARVWGEAEYLPEGLILSNHYAGVPLPPSASRLNFILMSLCTRGEAHYTVDTRQQNIKPGDLLFVSENHIVDNYIESSDYASLCIMVSTTFYHDFVQNVKNVSSLLLFTTKNPVVSLLPAEVQTFSNYFQTIREKIARKDHPYRVDLVKALLLSMFYDMSGVIYRVEQKGQRLQSRADLFFSRFIQLLEQNFRRERRVSWYADQLHITPKYLSEIVRQVSLRTPTDWIDDYVVLEIRVMLKNSTKNIREITEALNFPNQSFFGKYFKDRVGMSPTEFRKSM